MSPKKKNESKTPEITRPEEIGLSSERLGRIRPRLQRFIDEEKVPNLVTMVIRHGKIAHFEAQGYMDFETRKAVQKDTLFRMWSNTKPITGAATMICVEEGLLKLDDPISKYIPAFKNPLVRLSDTASTRGAPPSSTETVPAAREITIRDCLRNTTGLASPRHAPVSYLTEFSEAVKATTWFSNPAKPTDIRKTTEALAKLPLDFQPGTQFIYHVGYPIVGLILEAVTGQTLERFYGERIFKPLGMEDTAFYISEAKLNRLPSCYRPVQQKGHWKLTLSERAEESEKVKGPKNFFEAGGGAGGVLSTISDYTRFSQMLLNGGELDGERILARKTVEIMTSNHIDQKMNIAVTGPGFGFGMGVGVYCGTVPPIMRSCGTFGWSGMAGTSCFMDPKEDLIFACFTQVLGAKVMPDNNYQEEFEHLVYQALL
jgi:CubicO group peptidase (beta-lactamase class C family)